MRGWAWTSPPFAAAFPRCFTVDGKHGGEIVRAVDAAAVGIKHGDFYARRLIDGLGLGAQGGVVRASMVHYNALDEVDRLIAALSPIVAPRG